MGILRRLRSILKTGVLWVVFWVPLSLLLSAGLVVAGEVSFSVATVLELALAYAATGFVTGCAFGTVISVAEARTSVARLRSWRMGLWGALAALVIPVALLPYGGWWIPSISLFVVNAAVTAAAGAGSAIAMLALARRAERLAPPDDNPLLP